MKIKQKAKLISSILALSATIYLPHASANTLSVPSPGTGDSFTIFNIAAGNFVDSYAFDVNSDAIFSFTGQAVDSVGTGSLIFLTHGASLTSVSLLDLTTSTSTSTLLSSTNFSTNDGTPANTFSLTTYTASLGGVLLSTTDSYELVFKGYSEVSNSSVNGTIFLSNAPAVVPLPGATWLFLTGLMGFLGLNRSRKAIS